MENMLEECDLTEEDAILMIYNSDGQLQYKVISELNFSVLYIISWIVLGWLGGSASFI